MIWLWIISLGIFITYNILLCWKSGQLIKKRWAIPLSISESAYLFGNKLIFWAWKMIYVLTFFLFWSDITDNHWLVVVSCFGLLVSGSTGDFHGKTEIESIFHTVGTLVCALCAQLWMWFVYPMSIAVSVILLPLGWFVLGPKIPGVHLYVRNTPMSKIEQGGSRIFWCEIFLFAMAYSSVLIYYIDNKI